mmetsp:Transcript_19922/g.42743  ORF Transcript_19922/g.42743 Transcript_19922/m.42743 type:complete len:122 (-) Transcript_19922:297-662(-)
MALGSLSLPRIAFLLTSSPPYQHPFWLAAHANWTYPLPLQGSLPRVVLAKSTSPRRSRLLPNHGRSHCSCLDCPIRTMAWSKRRTIKDERKDVEDKPPRTSRRVGTSADIAVVCKQLVDEQ